MNCKVIAVSQPRIEECATAEELVAYCARVSNPTNQANKESSGKLVKYLINNQHWSPLEMVHITIEIETTRDIARQILRHRSFSFQEFSQRYAEVDDTWFTTREARLQDQKNRQNSIETQDDHLQEMWDFVQKDLREKAVLSYKWALNKGIAKEQARVVLPEGMTKSRMYMAGSLRSWVHYCQLRMGNGTQKEHRLIAEEIWELLCEEFPAISSLLVDSSEEAKKETNETEWVRITVNGKSRIWPKGSLISYTDVYELAYPGPTISYEYSCTYHDRTLGKSGMLFHGGDKVTVSSGMNFDICYTGNA